MSEMLNQHTGEIREAASILGKHMARLCDVAEPDARLKMPKLLPRCHSCAFKAGEHLPNNQATTLMDAIKCVMEGHEFYCHQKDRKGCLCSGWAMMMLAKSKPDFVEKVDWDFSDEEPKP
jgi:hypothetical protein